ncbi:amidohydrolase [Sphingomonas sp. LB2R24]|uniref:amidohydrolase n=1 Tax=Sphingomonas sorbitolis TaxID=3096165 RepID=UPI002FC62FB9
MEIRVMFAAVALLASTTVRAEKPTAARAAIDAFLEKGYSGLAALREDIHAHPELGFHEKRTASLLAARMRALGFSVTEGVGGTGVVAMLKNGEGPTAMIRTELDALPMEEATGLPYQSREQAPYNGGTTFVAHSCGHDTHMAAWVGAAGALVANKALWHGTLMFIAQPSEETVGGARKMIADGLFSRFPKPDYGFAAHVDNAPTGSVKVKDGAATSNSDAVVIDFKGRGGHGSMPSLTIDPVVMAAHFVTDVQTVISRQKDANSFGVITVGSFQAGSVGNIIPDSAHLKLTLRSFTPDVRELLIAGVERTANAVAVMGAAPAPDIRYPGGTGAVVNDHALSVRVAAYLTAASGDKVVFVPSNLPGWSASEDFSAYIDAGVPSVFFSIGGYSPARLAEYAKRGEPVPTNHSPLFAPDEKPAIITNARTLALAAMTVLGRPG